MIGQAEVVTCGLVSNCSDVAVLPLIVTVLSIKQANEEQTCMSTQSQLSKPTFLNQQPIRRYDFFCLHSSMLTMT